MRVRIFLLVATTIFVVSVEASSAGSVQTHPNNALPGVPVEFVINATNADPCMLSNVKLRVTDSEGNEFVASNAEGTEESESAEIRHGGQDRNAAPVDLAKASYVIPVRPSLGGPSFFNDPRLAVPGTYKMRLKFAGCAATVESEEFKLTVAVPTGVDNQTWQELRSLLRGPASLDRIAAVGPEAAQRIWNVYRESNYLPFFADMVNPIDEKELACEFALRRGNLPASLRDSLVFNLAGIHYTRGMNSFPDGDVVGAERHFEKMRSYLARLSSGSALRERLESEFIPSREQMIDIKRRNDEQRRIEDARRQSIKK